MKKNMGTLDVIIRLLVAALFIILFATGVIKGVVGIILLVIAAVFILTSIFRFCPLYFPFKISTAKKE